MHLAESGSQVTRGEKVMNAATFTNRTETHSIRLSALATSLIVSLFTLSGLGAQDMGSQRTLPRGPESFMVHFLWEKHKGIHGIGVINEETRNHLPDGRLRDLIIVEVGKILPLIVRDVPSRYPWGSVRCFSTETSPPRVRCPIETARVFLRDPSYLIYFVWNEGIQELRVKNLKTLQEESVEPVRTAVVEEATKSITQLVREHKLNRAYGTLQCWGTYRPPFAVDCRIGRGEEEEDIHDPDSETPLMSAIQSDDYEALRELIAKGTDVNAKDQSGFTALMLAVSTRHIRIVEALLSAGADPNAHPVGEGTALMLAVGSGELVILQDLLRAHAEVDAGDEDGITALHFAVIGNRVELARALVAAGANVNQVSAGRRTPLMDAADSGAFESAKLLIEAHADVNAKDEDGNTALSIAQKTTDSSPKLVELLRKAGAQDLR